MQNIFPSRELYNSNPCRDMWDSEQYSQVPMSCSQGSQNSSSDMFSQSKMSQLKGFSSFDVWSQPTNSQQLPEDEPAKYYMKYMAKPPLFSSENERQTRPQKPQTTASYRELIEIQKKKTTEREDRDVLDSFISLLKDYTKEVKTAMDSFKDSIDTTLASKAEQVASAASESADLIKKLKDDLLEGFGCLRKDLKENEELKEVIARQNEKIVEQDSQIKMLQTQLDDYRTREVKSTEKHEKYLQREDKLLQKLDEISNRQKTVPQVPHPVNQIPMVQNVSQQQTSECLQYGVAEGYVPQHQAATSYHHHWGRTEAPSSVRLHHIQPGPHPSIHNTTAEALHLNGPAPNYIPAAATLDYQYPSQSSLPASKPGYRSQDDAVVPASVNVQYQGMQSQQAVTHPTATIAPMRPVPNQHEQLICQQEGNETEPVVLRGEKAAIRPPVEVVLVAEKQPEETNRTLPSPGVCAPILSKTAWPKHSPVAAVQPQIRVKKEGEGGRMKVSRSPCSKRARKEDPFDIFVFDLTSSPEEESFDAQKPNPTVSKTAPKYPMNTHATRSKKLQKTGEEVFVNPEEKIHKQRKSSTPSAKKTTSANENTTPNRPIKARLENGIPRSKVAQNVFQRPKTTFKRNAVAAKRALTFDASVFDGLDDDVNILQITESIRKHAQRKWAAKVL